jgi:cob(I)alamin adenosyltransferase
MDVPMEEVMNVAANSNAALDQATALAIAAERLWQEALAAEARRQTMRRYINARSGNGYVGRFKEL